MATFERWSIERYRQEQQRQADRAGRDRSPKKGKQSKSGQTKDPGKARPSARRNASGDALAKSRHGLELYLRDEKYVLASGFPTEESIHRDCAKWVFDNQVLFPVLKWLLHVPNGGHRSRGEAGKMKAMGVRQGVSDWIHPFPSPAANRAYRGLAIELKSHKGELSDEQSDFLADAAAAGWLTGTARTQAEFATLVMDWLGFD